MKRYLSVDLNDGRCNVISESEFEEVLEFYGEKFEKEFIKSVGINGVVSYKSEEELFIIGEM